MREVPIDTAFIIVDENSLSPSVRLGGLPLLTRTLQALHRAGVSRCYVVGISLRTSERDQLDSLCVTLAQSPLGSSMSISVLPVDSPQLAQSVQNILPSQPFITVRPDYVFAPGLCGDMAESVGAESGVGVEWDENEWAMAVIPSAFGPAILECLGKGENPLRRKRIRPDSDTHVWSSSMTVIDPERWFAYALHSSASIPKAERALLHALENPRDGYTDTYFYRWFSRPISQWTAASPLRPNHITLCFFGVGLLGAWCFAQGGYWFPVLGGLLLMAAVVLDNVDGEVARLKFQESAFGEWLDNTCGTIMYLAAFIGVGVSTWHKGAIESLGLLIGVLCAFPLVTWAERTTGAGNWADAGIKGMVKVLTSHDFVCLFFLSALIDVLDSFLWGAAIGVHVFWVVLALLLVCAGRPPSLQGLYTLLKPPSSSSA